MTNHSSFPAGTDWIGCANELPPEEKWQGEFQPGDLQKRLGGCPQRPSPQLRKRVILESCVCSARWTICALGYVDPYISGRALLQTALNPAVSDFSKRRLVISLDVPPDLFLPGENVLGLWLGRGWYARGLPGVDFDGPLVKAALHLEFDNGDRLDILTDASWEAHESAYRATGTYDHWHFVGEEYTGAADSPDWSSPMSSLSWKPVAVFLPHDLPEAIQECPHTKIVETRTLTDWRRLPDGSLLGDLGACVTGQLEMRVALKDSDSECVSIEYGDKFLPDGSMQTFGQRDEWVTPGKGLQTFRNRFEYHAFRYVRISGLGDAQIVQAHIHLIQTGCTPAGTFVSSDPLLNQIFSLVRHTLSCLLQGGVLQDCPHRERLGYGDGQAPIETAVHCFEMQGFLKKWFRDWQDVQDPTTGNIKHTAPSPYSAGGGPAWSAAGLHLNRHLELYYGDDSLAPEAYAMADNYLRFLESKMHDGLLARYGREDWGFLGDWVAPGKGMMPEDRVDANSTALFNNCYFVLLLDEGIRLAEKNSEPKRAAHWRSLTEQLRIKIHAQWFDPDRMTYANGEPSYLVMPLLAEVVPPARKRAVEDSLRYRILDTDKGHINTGMLGTWFLFQLCIERGWNDLVFSMATKRTFPGWGHMIEQGATTIWEEWNGDNSQIHSCHLSIGQWLFQGIGGIRPVAPGFSKILLSPAITLPIDWFECRYPSPLGLISTSWKRQGTGGTLSVIIPNLASATLKLPEGVTSVGTDLPEKLSPGQYQFVLQIAAKPSS